MIAQEIAFWPSEPGVGALTGNDVDDARVDVRVAQRLAGNLVDEDGQGRSPRSLAADQPVGPALDHAPNPGAPGLRIEPGVVDRVQCCLAQRTSAVHLAFQGFVQADEPLRRVAEDHRRFGSPGVRIAVLQPSARQEGARFDQPVGDRRVGRSEPARPFAFGLHHRQSAEQRHRRIVDAVFVDGLGNVPVTVG